MTAIRRYPFVRAMLSAIYQQPRTETRVLGCAVLLRSHCQRLTVDVHFTDDGRTFQVGQARWQVNSLPGRESRRNPAI